MASVVADEHAAVDVRAARSSDAPPLVSARRKLHPLTLQVVLPGTPATHLFRVTRKPDAARPIEQQLRLGIRYRSVREGPWRSRSR